MNVWSLSNSLSKIAFAYESLESYNIIDKYISTKLIHLNQACTLLLLHHLNYNLMMRNILRLESKSLAGVLINNL